MEINQKKEAQIKVNLVITWDKKSERGIFMNAGEVKIWINDYLDLYLYAKSMNDVLWQQEIIEKLQHSPHNTFSEATIQPLN